MCLKRPNEPLLQEGSPKKTLLSMFQSLLYSHKKVTLIASVFFEKQLLLTFV